MVFLRATLIRRVGAVLVLCAVSVAAEQPSDLSTEPTIQLPPELARVLRDYEAAWSRKDAAALARLFADDGYVLPNGGAPVKGRAAIQRHYTGSGGPLFLRAFAYAAEGSVGYILGGYAGEKNRPDMGKFTLTLRKDGDGTWLIVSDMDSPNRRPARSQ
jgi:ketosteroid isomerase-like protein